MFVCSSWSSAACRSARSRSAGDLETTRFSCATSCLKSCCACSGVLLCTRRQSVCKASMTACRPGSPSEGSGKQAITCLSAFLQGSPKGTSGYRCTFGRDAAAPARCSLPFEGHSTSMRAGGEIGLPPLSRLNFIFSSPFELFEIFYWWLLAAYSIGYKAGQTSQRGISIAEYLPQGIHEGNSLTYHAGANLPPPSRQMKTMPCACPSRATIRSVWVAVTQVRVVAPYLRCASSARERNIDMP